MPLQYGEAFDRMGVPRMGRIGAPWCGLAPDGVMVFMAHQNFFRKEEGTYFYVDETASALAPAPSAIETDRRMRQYFEAGKREIRLIIGTFHEDGDKLNAARFHHAAGTYYLAELEWIRPGGLQRAKVLTMETIPAAGHDWARTTA